MKKLVLTGAAGRLGSYLREPLSKMCDELVSTDLVDDIGNLYPGETYAKEWHDFIGITEDDQNSGDYYISINHERIEANDSVGDGGGMTVFKVERDQDTDTLRVVSQTLDDGK